MNNLEHTVSDLRNDGVVGFNELSTEQWNQVLSALIKDDVENGMVVDWLDCIDGFEVQKEVNELELMTVFSNLVLTTIPSDVTKDFSSKAYDKFEQYAEDKFLWALEFIHEAAILDDELNKGYDG